MTKTVLITGATSGIGLAFCKEFSKRGHNIILVSRSLNKLETTSKELRENYKVKTFIFAKDLAAVNAAPELYKKIKESNLDVDILVNNAAFSNTGLLTSIPIVKMNEELSLNIISLTNLIHLILQDMQAKKNGVIINLASVASFYPAPYESVYAATKAYVLSLSEALHYEYKELGVRVLAVCPGYTETSFFDGRKIPYSRARTAEMVVNTTMNALNTNRSHVVDGFKNKLESKTPRFLSRKTMLEITGKSGKKNWGN